MPSTHVLLRCLLIVAFCLEGSLSLWATSAMAAENVHGAIATDHTMAPTIGEDCDDSRAVDADRVTHSDCDCVQGPGCTCAFVFPVGAMAQSPFFAARQRPAAEPVLWPRPPVRVVATARVFRPPIA